MKIVTLLIFSSLFITFSNANVVPSVSVQISELYFSNESWQLEIKYFQYDPDDIKIDSIELRCSADTVMLRYLNLLEIESVIVITPDSLQEEFKINSKGDIIEVVGYCQYGEISWNLGYNYLKFGNQADDMIGAPNTGESITQLHFTTFEKDYDRYKYTICTKPSIGKLNEFEFGCGILKGTLFNYLNEPQTNGVFWLDNSFIPDESGKFQFQVGSYKHDETELAYNACWNGSDGSDICFQKFVIINDLIFNPRVGEVLEIDIYLKEEINTVVKESKMDEFKVYPNPISNKISIKPSNYQKYSSLQINLTDIKGLEVASFTQSAGELIEIDLQNNIKAGIYILSIQNQGEVIFSDKVIINPF